jgi:PAS domain S-box-containing protein
MRKGFSLRFKLIMAFLIVAAVLAAGSFYQIRSTQRINHLFADLSNHDTLRLSALNELSITSIEVRGATFEYQHEVFEGNTQEQKDAATNLDKYEKELTKAQKHYRTLISKDKPYVSDADLDAIGNSIELLISSSEEVVRTTDASHSYITPEGAEGDLEKAQQQLDRAIEAATVDEQKGIDTENQEVVKTVQNVLKVVILLAFATIGLAVFLGFWLSGWISHSISRLRTGVERIANGDFSRPFTVKSNDEIGQLTQAFNRMSERLRESYRRLALERQQDEAMLQGMGEGLIAVDGEGKILMINEVATKLLGLPDESFAIGKPVHELYQLYESDAKENDEALHLQQRPSYITLTMGQDVEGVYGFHAATGNKYLLNISSSPVKLDEKVVGAVTVLRDVTKEKEIDRMKTEFISLASHQLRTPLSAIKWFTEMLVSGDAGTLQPEQLDFAKNIADSTERMIALVNALLNISRIESGRIMIDPKPTDLSELVGGIVNDLKAKTEEKKQSLIISVHEDLPKINLDPRLISQVYLNLLTNAIKYTPKGGEISVFISKKDDQVISQVADSGYGIPKEQQGRIFQKFFRAANAVKVETDGTGLGLYLIKAIVESSGGKIWFESEEGKGSTFWFSIPLSGMKPKAGEVTLDI